MSGMGDSHAISIEQLRKVGGPLVDVRSPGEYAQGHWPGAINIPLFSDAERAEVGTTYNFCAQHVLSMIDAFEAGDLATARRKQLESVQLIRTMQRYSFAPAAKAAMNLVGVDCGPVRAPLTNLTLPQKSALLEELRSSPVFAGSAAASDAVLNEA